MNRLPLFPLQVVLFPNVPLPLHVFEERYRLMIARCIEDARPFGVVYHHGESLQTVGCSAIVQRVIKEYDDGRMDILAVGHERFVINALDESGPYLEADVRFLGDDPMDEDDSMLQRAVDELLRYAEITDIDLDRDAVEALTEQQLSFLIAGLDVLGLDTKQALLEADGTEERLQRATTALGRVNERLAAEAKLEAALGLSVDIDSFLN